MRRLSVLCALASLAIATPALAAGYGSAGCGLGSMLFGPGNGFVQVFAATTNGLSASQTFGISSGTSNCADTSGGHASAKVFIEVNREALAKDMSRGSGETLANLSALAGCSDAAAVGVSLQKNFKSIVPSADVSTENMSTNILSTLKADKTLSCNKLG